MPLATQAAANIINTSDPIWCPTGQTPGDAGCTSSETTVTALITDLGSKTGAGTVYFTSTYSTNDATFDHTNASLTGLTDLTIQGGWNGLTGGSYLLSGISSFSVPLTVTNWIGDVTLNDLAISGAAGNGLTVNTAGNIHVHHVSSDATADGAYLNNSSGSSSITVDGSSNFSGNNNNGLEAYSNGAITLDNVTADGNDGNTTSVGAILWNDYSGSNGVINISDSEFSDNIFGLSANSMSNITLTNVYANGNGFLGNIADDGAYLDNTGVHYGGSGTVSVTDSDFSGNTGKGLEVHSNNNITLTEVAADSNRGESGAFLKGAGNGTIVVDNTLGGEFNGNTGNGLDVYAKNDITLTNVYADANGLAGAQLDNRDGWGNINIDFNGSTVSGNSDFSSNLADGLVAFSAGAITLYNVTADHNFLYNLTADENFHGDGAYLENDYGSSDVSVNNSAGGEGFNANVANGLEVYSNGNVSLTNVTASNNGKVGTYLDNSTGTGSVSVDPSTFSFNSLDGLDVTSTNTIYLTDVTADFNGQSLTSGSGAVLDNTGGNGNICVDWDCAASQAGSSEFNFNYNDGLHATSEGEIDLYQVTASANGGDGAFLENCNCLASSNINIMNSTFGGASSADGNLNNGLEAYSTSGVRLDNVSATYNRWDGALLGDPNSPDIILIGGNVTVDGGDFSHNYGNQTFYSPNPAGLEVYTYGDINLSGVTADNNFNTTGGVYLDTTYGSGGVTIDSSMGPNSFSNNGYVGLSTRSSGDVSLSDVTASGNQSDGLSATSYIDITLSDVIANINHGNGASLFGNQITVDPSQFDHNSLNGLIISANSTVSLSDVDASFNGSTGAYIDNSFGTGDVIIDPSAFNNNGSDGVYIATTGNATVSGCSQFKNNGGYGINASLTGGTLTLNGAILSGNTSGDTNVTGGTLVNNSGGCGGSGSGGGKNGPQGNNLPVDIIPVTGGLDCTNYSATEIALPNQDHILLPCPTTGNATLTGQTGNQLPGKLDARYTFISAFNAAVTPTLDGSMTVSFKIPAGQANANLTILHWDGSKWVDVGGSSTSDGFFQTQTNLTGVFVLVTR